MTDYNQYVNIDPTSADQRGGDIPVARAGRRLKLKATIDPAVENVMLSVEIIAGGNNFPEDVIEARNLRDREAEKGKKRALTNAQGEAEVEFDLSLFGGDEFTFKVRTVIDDVEGPPRDHPDKFTVWKRFYYQITRFDQGPKGANRGGGNLAAVAARNFANVATEFAARRHNIEMVEQQPTAAVIARQGNVIDISTHEAQFRTAAREGYDATKEPVAMKIVLVNQMATPAERNITFNDLYAAKTAVIKVERDLAHDLWVDESKPLGDDWFVRAQWAWTNTLDPMWYAFDRANLRVVGARRIEVTIPILPARSYLYENERGISLYLEYRSRSGVCPGLSDNNTIWLATADMGNQAAGAPTAQVAITAAKFELVAIHEVGHFLGMVPISQPTWYEGKGHSGPHCATGVPPDERRQARFVGKPGSCVMFGGPSTPPDAQQSEFCAECDRTLRARLVTDLTMPAEWR